MLREKAADAGQAAWDKTMQAIEKWLEEFPRLEAYGLRVSNFGFVVGISPALEVELQGEHSSFPSARLTAILAENKPTNTAILLPETGAGAARLPRVSGSPG